MDPDTSKQTPDVVRKKAQAEQELDKVAKNAIAQISARR
jgi:hypothetical protein